MSQQIRQVGGKVGNHLVTTLRPPHRLIVNKDQKSFQTKVVKIRSIKNIRKGKIRKEIEKRKDTKVFEMIKGNQVVKRAVERTILLSKAHPHQDQHQSKRLRKKLNHLIMMDQTYQKKI